MRRLKAIAFLLLLSSQAHAAFTVFSHDFNGLRYVDYYNNIYWAKTKIAFGADGLATDVTSSTPFPTFDSQVDGDLLAFKNANHADLALIDSDLLSFKSANHVDLTLIDTDLNAFKTANHTDVISPTTTANGAGVIAEASYLTRAGKMFSTTTDVVSAASTNETPFLLFVNPVGSGKSVRLENVLFSATVANGEYTVYRCYLDPTVTTNGTPIPVTGNRQTGQSPSVVSAYLLPTISVNGTIFFAMSSASGNTESSLSGFSQWIEAGHRMMCTTKQKAANDVSGITLQWAEE